LNQAHRLLRKKTTINLERISEEGKEPPLDDIDIQDEQNPENGKILY